MRHALLAFLALWLINTAAQAACAPKTFEENRYIVCRFDAAKDRLALFDLDATGQPYGTFAALDQALRAQGKTLAFAMNAGMFDEKLKPIGLYVERGRPLKKINRKDGGGNFHLKPNGIFYVMGASVGVMETEAYMKAGLKPDFATQSGPMLVIDGHIHPKFTSDSISYKRRNGVGAVNGHEVVFAISDGAVTFHDFARLFRDELHCRNALFLDGSVSSLHAPELGRSDAFVPLGPIVGLAK